jgi:hypothetical protein
LVYPALLGIFIVSSVSLFLCLYVSPLYLSIFLFLPSVSLSLPSISMSLPSFSMSLPSISMSLPSISMSLPSIFLFLPSISLSFYHLSLCLSISPPSLFQDKKFPALDPSLATPHLYSRKVKWLNTIKNLSKDFIWEMFNCSNCNSSKKWSTQKYNCSKLFEQTSKKVTAGWKSKIICRTCNENFFRAVSLLSKKIMTTQIATGQQRFWKMSTAWHNL